MVRWLGCWIPVLVALASTSELGSAQAPKVHNSVRYTVGLAAELDPENPGYAQAYDGYVAALEGSARSGGAGAGGF